MILGLMFKYLIHFNLVLWVVWNSGSIILHSFLQFFPVIFVEDTILFSLLFFFLLLFQLLVDCICVGLILSPIFDSIGECVYFHVSTILFLLLWLCDAVCNLKVWYLWLYSFFSQCFLGHSGSFICTHKF